MNHEKTVCRFGVEEFTRSRNGGHLTVDAFPDDDERGEPAVDLVGHDEIGEVVAEHTVLEAYEGQLFDYVRTQEILRSVASGIGPLRPPGSYMLVVDTRSGHLTPRRTSQGLVDGIIQWVRAQDPPEPEVPATEPNYVTGGPPEVGLPVALYRMTCSPTEDGSFRFAFDRPEDLEAQRLERAARALDRKCPKLESSRRPSSTTLLVLESRDFVMSNPWLVARAVHESAKVRSDVPDAIFIIDTTPGVGAWIPYRLKDRGGWLMGVRD